MHISKMVGVAMAEVRTKGWGPARLAAGVAGVLLIWRGLFGRGGGVPLLAGAWIVWRVLAPRSLSAAGAGAKARRPAVVEGKSPGELQPGAASGPHPE